MKGFAAFALAITMGCSSPTQRVTLRVELPAELASQVQELKVSPATAELGRRTERGIAIFELKQNSGNIRLLLPGACPLALDTRRFRIDRTTEQRLLPLFDVGPGERVVGLGQAFELQAQPNCPEAESLHAAFAVTSGAPLENVEVTRGGRQLRASTRSAAPTRPTSQGVLPVSAREQQSTRTQIAFQVALGDATRYSRALGVSAVARASGLHDVGLDHPLLLKGDLRLLDKPEGSQAALRQVGELLELRPDLPGRYRLTDARGGTLSIHSGRYDEQPLDCGRSDCHAQIAESAQHSPMTQVLASDLGGCHSLTDPACASACHATGEPGTNDGGFTQVASELGLPALPAEYDHLPRALRRLGGVGCLACHGPTKIPEVSSRFALLSNDVCAVCHDLPPRYGHVTALATSRMGYADSSPAVRDTPACARCHTSWGALGRSAPPAHVAGMGITCPTCHDVHPHSEQDAAKNVAHAAGNLNSNLLRDFPWPPTLPEPPAAFRGPSRVCVGCHAPSSRTLNPEASAVALVVGQAGLEPATGLPLSLPGPHAQNEKGCLSCHNSGPSGLVLGESHGFRATEVSCARCHTSPPPRDPSLAQRAQRLLERLDPRRSAARLDKPWHASARVSPRAPELARAVYDVLLVLEDPAADVHHPSYAKALLDAAERSAPGAPP